jgi:4-hydroxy-tetrahydrodipicolinate synthase
MTDLHHQLHGLWLPLITPFRDGALDEGSLRGLVSHYATEPVDGLILGATSGEGLSLSQAERERLVELVRDQLAGIGRSLPICLGMAGASTDGLKDMLQQTASWPIDGYLVSSPFYLRPSQRGLSQHFTDLADHAAHPIVLYNIPYRSAVGLENETLLRLAEHQNIVGLKDCCANRAQTRELLQLRPDGFRVLTGEDAHAFDALEAGADGAILLSAHIETGSFAAIQPHLKAGNAAAAAARWQQVDELTRLLFIEPSPAPAKYWLAQTGLIASPEVRLPMVDVGAETAARLDRVIARRAAVATRHVA